VTCWVHASFKQVGASPGVLLRLLLRLLLLLTV
jgi:hypothetical protein